MLPFQAVSNDSVLADPFVNVRVFVFDLDGVLYRGAEVVECAAESLARLRELPQARLFFLTNNSTQDRSDYVAKLTGLGMPCTEDEIVTSASATAEYVSRTLHATGKVVLCVGGHGIRDEMARVGMLVRRPDEPPVEGEHIDYVVAGLDRQFNYHTLHRAMQAILSGASFIATNRDGQYPVEGGKFTPGGGAIVAAIAACTEVEPVVVGKPETVGLQTLLDRAGVRADEALMIGDRLDTDVLCGNRLGVPTVLVLTGVTPEARVADAPPEMRPGHVLHTLRDLFRA
jgi:4-nitrophenyl phosphatase